MTNMEDIRNKLEHSCTLQKSDGGFRMVEWMISVGSLYKNCLLSVREFEQAGMALNFILSLRVAIRFMILDVRVGRIVLLLRS